MIFDFGLRRMSSQVFRAQSPSAAGGCCLAAPRSRRGWFHPFLVAGASALRAGRHCSVCPRSSCRETWPTHTPANAIWPVSKKGQMTLFGYELRSAYPATSVAGRGAGSRRRAVIFELVALLVFLLPAPWSPFGRVAWHRRRRLAPPVNLGWVGCVALDAPFEFILNS